MFSEINSTLFALQFYQKKCVFPFRQGSKCLISGCIAPDCIDASSMPSSETTPEQQEKSRQRTLCSTVTGATYEVPCSVWFKSGTSNCW